MKKSEKVIKQLCTNVADTWHIPIYTPRKLDNKENRKKEQTDRQKTERKNRQTDRQTDKQKERKGRTTGRQTESHEEEGRRKPHHFTRMIKNKILTTKKKIFSG